jgi:fatty acid desaturase
MTGSGQGLENDGTAFYRWRFASAVKSSLWLVVFGTVWLLFTLHLLPWSWPLFWPMVLIAAGVTLLFNRIVHPGYYGQDYRNDAGYAGPSAPPAATPPVAPVTTTELAPRDPLQHPRDRQEGR